MVVPSNLVDEMATFVNGSKNSLISSVAKFVNEFLSMSAWYRSFGIFGISRAPCAIAKLTLSNRFKTNSSKLFDLRFIAQKLVSGCWAFTWQPSAIKAAMKVKQSFNISILIFESILINQEYFFVFETNNKIINNF